MTLINRLWTATSHGLAVLDHGSWRALDTGGFRARSIRYVARSHDRRLCVGYSEANGATCFATDGRSVSELEHIGVAEGLTSNMLYTIGADRRGRLWIGTGDGINVVTPRGPEQPPLIEHFADHDGLAGNDSTAMAFLEDADGSIWLGSTSGLSHVHADRYDGPPAPPATAIRAGHLGDQPIGATPALETPHDRSALTLEFGAATLTDADRVEYQVRLLPLEREWSWTRLREVRYPMLHPGTYRFEVRARIGAGVWGPVSELRFTVRRAWWQTRWFLVSACVALALAIGGVFTWRQRALLRRRTRQLTEQSDATLRALLELVPDLIGVQRDGKTVYLNRAARRLFGAETGELPELADRIHADDRPRFEDLRARAPAPDPHETPEIAELRMRAGDHTWRICEVSSVWMEIGGARVLILTGRDVTDRHRMRAKLLVSDRMASLGTLAAGIAHEINNPLSYVIGNLQLMSEALDSAPRAELASAMADATEGAERVRTIVQGLRSFSRSEEERRVMVDVADVLQAAIRLTANEVRHRAQLVCQLEPTPQVIADTGRLTQVFINLLVNAAHAIAEGRSGANTITVRTRTDEHGRAVIEIADTGQGMSVDVQARVFDPFFTTKQVGEGTGLGLSICHGIVSALGGQISIDSALGRGTVVCVVLPPAEVAEVGEAAVPVAPSASAAAVARSQVLVVDDEPHVGEMLGRMLRRDHEVTVVSGGAAALACIKDGARFDAIVSDVMMPEMTGVELLEELMRVAPAQAKRLIFLSGGVFAPQTRSRLDELGTVRLDKPIGSHELRGWVMRVVTGEAMTHELGTRNPTTLPASAPSSPGVGPPDVEFDATRPAVTANLKPA